MRTRKRHLLLSSGLAASAIVLCGGAPPEDQKAAGEAAAQQALDAWSAKEDVEQKLALPLTDGSPMTTLDGTTTFSQPVSCLSTSSFLRMFFAPGAGGDVSPLTVSQDLDLDGTLDVTQSIPFPISGVCANGVISCSAGTWDACQGYEWGTASPSNPTLALVPTGSVDMQACFCVNDSCGSGLVAANEAEIGSTLAAGMSSALMNHDPRFSVASVGQTPFEVTLAGQDTASCRAGDMTHTDYLANPDTMGADGDAASGSDTIFTALANSPAATGTATVNHTCSIEKNLIVPEDIHSFVNVNSSHAATTMNVIAVSQSELVVEIGVDEDRYLDDGPNTCTIGFPQFVDIRVERPEFLESVVIEEVVVDDWAQIHIDGAGGLVFAHPAGNTNFGNVPPPGSCERTDGERLTPNADVTNYFADGNWHQLRLRTHVGGERGESFMRLRIKTKCEPELILQDACGALASNNACRLLNETADGVVTYTNGANTGLAPIPSTRSGGSGVCEASFTEPWWEKARTYACTTETADATPTPNLDRAVYIYENATLTSWSDRRSDGAGGFITESGAFDVSAFFSEETCEQTCKVRLEAADTEVSTTGPTNVPRTGEDNREVIYQFHSCTPQGTCPVGSNETLVQDCGCLDDFPEAIVAMQAVRLGGKDITCTTGTPQPW